jgi:peptide-methionine (R)-S-oxide reductase
MKILWIIFAIPLFVFASCKQTMVETLPEITVYKNNAIYTAVDTGKTKYEVTKTDAEWKQALTADQYEVLRNKATERPHTGEFDQHFEKGYYICAGCSTKLFSSNTKFDAHCGWPSFFAPEDSAAIEYVMDYAHGMVRTEVRCSKCGGHLGHVFEDGPNPTGQRYCINSISLGFIKDGAEPDSLGSNDGN